MFNPIDNVCVIGIGHKCRQGKDTAGRYLIERYGAQKFSFGSGLYSVARCLFGMTEKDAPLLQALGTEIGRRNDDLRWIRNTYYQIKDESPHIAVLTDVRFPNEADFVRALGGKLIRITRIRDGARFVAPDRDPSHPSETALDSFTGWDADLSNFEGDPSYLYTQLDALIALWRR